MMNFGKFIQRGGMSCILQLQFLQQRHFVSKMRYDFTINNEAIKSLPILSFPGNKVILEDNTSENELEKKLLMNSSNLLGFGSEKMLNSNGEEVGISYELVSKDFAVIWDTNRIKFVPNIFKSLLINPKITKVAYEALSDLKELKERHNIEVDGVLNLYQIAFHLKCYPKTLHALAAMFLKARLSRNQESIGGGTSQNDQIVPASWVSREVLLCMRQLYSQPAMHCERLMSTRDLLDDHSPIFKKTSFLWNEEGESTSIGTNSGGVGGVVTASSVDAIEDQTTKRNSSLANLVALCVEKEYALHVDGFIGDYESFKTSFIIEANGEKHHVTSRRSHRTLRSAQDDAAELGLQILMRD